MYKNRASSGRNNICGEKLCLLRKQLSPKVSQRAFAQILNTTTDELLNDK